MEPNWMNWMDPLPGVETLLKTTVEKPVEPVKKFSHVFNIGDRVIVSSIEKSGTITNINKFGVVFVQISSGYILECNDRELRPQGFLASDEVGDVQKSSREDFLPLGPDSSFVKSAAKSYKIGDLISTHDGTGKVVRIEGAKIYYSIPGGEGFFLSR